MPDLQVRLCPIDQLIPHPKNARTHDDAQIAQIAASIQEFGWTNPILVDASNGIIAGHARLLAARKLNLTEVPVIVLGHLTEAQRRALMIADNQLALNAGWDEELLRAELRALEAEDFNLNLLGFSDIELGDLLADDPAAYADEDAIPEVPKTPVSTAGALWLLDQHRVLCGDATKPEVVARLLGDRQPILMVVRTKRGGLPHCTGRQQTRPVNRRNRRIRKRKHGFGLNSAG